MINKWHDKWRDKVKNKVMINRIINCVIKLKIKRVHPRAPPTRAVIERNFGKDNLGMATEYTEYCTFPSQLSQYFQIMYY